MSLVFSQILEQLNLSKTATLGTETGAIVDMFKQESMWIIRPRGQKVSVVERWPLVEVQLYLIKLASNYFLIFPDLTRHHLIRPTQK